MKTIKRSSLEDLSKTMPVLSEKEQNVMVGMTQYYSWSGSGPAKMVFRGSTNDGYNDVLFIPDYSSLPLSRYEGYGLGYKPQLSDSDLMKLLTCRAASGINITGDENMEGYNGTYDPVNGNIKINLTNLRSTYNSTNGNVTEFIGTMKHEIAHYGTSPSIKADFNQAFAITHPDWLDPDKRSNPIFLVFEAMTEYIAYNSQFSIAEFNSFSTSKKTQIAAKSQEYYNILQNYIKDTGTDNIAVRGIVNNTLQDCLLKANNYVAENSF